MTDTTYDNSTELDPRIAARLKRDAKGLVAAVIQQYDTREVLMVSPRSSARKPRSRQ